MMAHVDLCSGIGGFALGFQWAGLSKPVLFCDIEPWSRKILKKHWPDVPIATDVKELANDPDGNVPDCDILTAGYPCQPFSHAGKRLGHEDDRHIWPYLLQIVAQKRPAWCCFENVYGHVSMGLDQVLFDLEAQGYATRPFIVPACGVDAPHRRDRVFVIAHSQSDRWDKRQSDQRRRNERNAPRKEQGLGYGGSFERGAKDVADTDSAGQQQSNQEMAREPSGQSDSGGVQPGQTIAHTSIRELQRRGEEQVYGKPDISRELGRGSQGESPQRSTLSGLGGMADGIPRWLDEPRDTPRTVKGVKGRADRLKGLGNAIVPQIAMKIGEAIKASIDEAKQ
jgi:DNA (cytosine-5)-methyltransferase 1